MNADRSENLAEVAEAATEFEGEIRELIRSRDVTFLRTPSAKGVGDASNLNSLIHRVAGNSTVEIENLIDQLQDMREYLQNEGARVSQEISSYAQASQSARSQVESISDQLAQWRASMQSTAAAVTRE
jgi:valyl-tRNA synthetase